MGMGSSAGGALQAVRGALHLPTSLLGLRTLAFSSSSLFSSRSWVPCRRRCGSQLVKINHSLCKGRQFFCSAAAVETHQSSTLAQEEIKDNVQSKPLWRASIDFKWIRDNKDAVALNVQNRKSTADVELVVKLYEQLCCLQAEVESLRAERNVVANKMKGKLDPSDRQTLIEEGKRLKEGLVDLEEDLAQLTDKLQQEAQSIPNITHPDVPIGGEDAASLRKKVGSKREFSFPVKDHVVLGQELDLFDFDAASECLAGTAEIPVGGMHMDHILAESLLPLKYVAFSHCFRTEAGAAGYATRGLYRVHQFSKVEMFIICRPEHSDAFHEELISIEEELFSSLGLHFQTLDMPSEDLGAPAYRKYDVETWMPGLGRYGEISSASNCTDYQSRRLNIRYRPAVGESTPSTVVKPKRGKSQLPPPKFVHTLNATACAVPRMIISILENFQQEDGSVVIPEALQPFVGGLRVIALKSKQ